MIAQGFDAVRGTAKVGTPGQCIASTVKRTDTILNGAGGVAKVYDFEIDTSTAGADYEVDINGVTVTFTAVGATDALVADELKAALEAEPIAGAVASFSITDGSGTGDVVRCTGRVPGNDFAASTGDAKLAGAEDTAAATTSTIGLGMPVYISSYDADGKHGEIMDANTAGELAAFAGITLKVGNLEGIEYPADDVLLVLQDGSVWVEVTGTPVYGGTVYADVNGAFYAAAGAGRTAIPTTAAKWERGADGLGLLRVTV